MSYLLELIACMLKLLTFHFFVYYIWASLRVLKGFWEPLLAICTQPSDVDMVVWCGASWSNGAQVPPELHSEVY